VDKHLPADRFAQEVRALIAHGGLTLDALADSIGVHPSWLRKVVTGEITELTLLTVVGICRRLQVMPEDIWDAGRHRQAQPTRHSMASAGQGPR